MKTPIIVLSTWAVTAVVGAVGTHAFVNSGVNDVSATTPDSGLVHWATHQTMKHSVARRLGANVIPEGLDGPETIAEGGQAYIQTCAVCHGRPGAEPTSISRGLNPNEVAQLSGKRAVRGGH